MITNHIELKHFQINLTLKLWHLQLTKTCLPNKTILYCDLHKYFQIIITRIFEDNKDFFSDLCSFMENP